MSSSSFTQPTAEEIRQFLPLVHRAVAGFLRKLPPSVVKDDLFAAGAYGLVDSLRRHKGERDSQFEWYARIRIRGAILDELRAQDWLTRRARGNANAANERGGNAAPATSFVGIEDVPGGETTISAMGAAQPTALDALEEKAERDELVAAVGALPERERYVVSAHYFEGVQFKAIAGMLGVSEPRISQIHSRAVGMLRARLVPKKESAA